jgi:hypothetical protein
MRKLIVIILFYFMQSIAFAGISTEDSITGKKISTPSNPASGYAKLYFKSDDNLYKLTSGGAEASFLTTEVDGSTTNEIEVVDEAYSAANFNGGTTSAVSQDDLYDLIHAGDSDDDGKADILDTTSNGFVKTTSGTGAISIDTSTYLTTSPQVFGITIDGGGSAITTGVKGYVTVPYTGTISRWDILADQSGSIVIDVWKDTYANFPPTVADTIAGSEKPTLSSAQKNQDTSLSSWTTSVTAGDVIGFNVDSATTVTRVTLTVKVDAT